MNYGTIEKIGVTGLLSAFAIYFRQLLAPLLVLVVVMGADYVTGVVAAFVTRTLSSRVGMIGIVKKCCYFAAVLVGMVADYAINSAGREMVEGFGTIHAVAILVTMWLIVNESISILENLGEIGVPFPKWLKKLLERLEDNGENDDEDTN